MRTNRGKTCGSAFGCVAALLGFLALCPAPATAQEVNTIKSLRTVQGGVEIELASTREFPVRDEAVALRIGAGEFTRSRYPEDGALNTLIFILTADEFAQTYTGDRVTVQYGRGESSDAWDFGTLDKSRLDQ